MKKQITTIFAVLAFGSVALAADPPKTASPTKAAAAPATPATPAQPAGKMDKAGAAPSGAPEMDMSPPTELDQLKDMLGTMSCKGNVTFMGQSMPVTSKMTSKKDLDGHWISMREEEKKQKGAPPGPGYKSQGYITYDRATKMFVSTGIDNMGGWSTSTSSGWQGDKMEWSGTSNMMGQKLPTKMTIMRAGKETKNTGNSGTVVSWDVTCKK
jgi:hypothetical protein